MILVSYRRKEHVYNHVYLPFHVNKKLQFYVLNFLLAVVKYLPFEVKSAFTSLYPTDYAVTSICVLILIIIVCLSSLLEAYESAGTCLCSYSGYAVITYGLHRAHRQSTLIA